MKTTKRIFFGKNQISTLSTYKAILTASYKEIMEVEKKEHERRLDLISKDLFWEEENMGISDLSKFGKYLFLYVSARFKNSKGKIQEYPLNLSSITPTTNEEEITEWEVECDSKEVLKKFLNYFPEGDKVQIDTITFSVGDKIKIRSKYEDNIKMLLYKGKVHVPSGGLGGIRYRIQGDDPTGKEGIIVELKEAHKGSNNYTSVIEFPNLVIPTPIERLEKVK